MMNIRQLPSDVYTANLNLRSMPKWLSDSEQERIAEFAATPKYKRDPEMLSPDDDEDDDE